MIDIPNPDAFPPPPEMPPLSVAQFEDLKARWRFTEVQLEGPRVLVSGLDITELWSLILTAEWAVKQADSTKAMTHEWADFIILSKALQAVLLNDDPKVMRQIAQEALKSLKGE